MPNPFKQGDVMLPIASVNSVVINGHKANDLFCPELIRLDLIELSKKYKLKIEQTDIQSLMEMLFKVEDQALREELLGIGYQYGIQLGVILNALLAPDEKIKHENLRWKEEHFAYWKEIKKIYLMGGLASSPFRPLFLEKINDMRKMNHLEHVNVEIIDSSQEKALEGMLYRYDQGHFLLFDFGQTSIKRAYVVRMHGMNLIERRLRHLPAQNPNVSQDRELIMCAYALENYIEDVIIQSLDEVKDDSCDILISIANYVNKGVLNPAKRSYGILSVLAPHYQDYLEERLSFRLKKRFHVFLEHDATAMSHGIPQEEHTAVITLGTAFGIAFID